MMVNKEVEVLRFLCIKLSVLTAPWAKSIDLHMSILEYVHIVIFPNMNKNKRHKSLVENELVIYCNKKACTKYVLNEPEKLN